VTAAAAAAATGTAAVVGRGREEVVLLAAVDGHARAVVGDGGGRQGFNELAHEVVTLKTLKLQKESISYFSSRLIESFMIVLKRQCT